MSYEIQLLFRLTFLLLPIFVVPFGVVAVIYGRNGKERSGAFIAMCICAVLLDFAIFTQMQ